MDLRSISNSVSTLINPNKLVSVKRSTGYTIGTGQKQIPTYSTPITGYGQIQALDAHDIRQLDGLNIQGTIRALYFKGVLSGVVRPDGTGGDLVTIDGQTWLVVKVLEGWPDWTKAAVVLQMPGA